MKLYFSILFLFTYLHIQAQEITSSRYYAEIISLVRSDILVLFPLHVRKADGSVFRVLTSNHHLRNCYYSDSDMRFHPEFADTISNILYFGFTGFDLNKCPKLSERSIDNLVYKKLDKQGIDKVLKKYFVRSTYNDIHYFTVKKVYLSKRSILTVLCFIADNNYLITSDNDGYYVANLID